MGIETFYKLKGNDFNEAATKLEDELNANNLIGNDNYRFAFRSAASQTKGWYSEVKFIASQNKIDIGTRENFKEVLNDQIRVACDARKKEYVFFLLSICNFLEFYYKWF